MGISFDGSGLDTTPFYSTFMSFWWVLTTITTVGYGDTFPTSLIGRLVGSFAMIIGVIGFAMPISIIGNSFEEEYHRLALSASSVDRAMGVVAVKDDDKPGQKEFFGTVHNALKKNGYSAKSFMDYIRQTYIPEQQAKKKAADAAKKTEEEKPVAFYLDDEDTVGFDYSDEDDKVIVGPHKPLVIC